MRRDEVLVIIPAYNEAGTVGEVVRSVQGNGFQQVVVVDDGSTDNTAFIARQAGAHVLSHVINRGPGAATQTGLTYARHNRALCAVTMDADKQHSVEDMDRLLGTLNESGADVVIGNRFMGGANFIPRSRVVFNGLANLATYVFASHWVSDTQSGYKAFSRRAIERIELLIDGFAFCSELIIKAQRAGLHMAEVPISVFYSKETARKGQSFATGMRTLAHLVQGYVFK